ncbi:MULTISPECIES: 5-dehydro-4-deoxyglucarate dehydratase [Streptomyces]|uniref:5-dehydro-4-deoxyglucarate dehydratase n=1 Tax=Streptomyces TaxID=1883 RepID=UPI00103DA83D|nr:MULTISPECIES: 5-dehydro-4-deoxyglucarate dehydratase [Streptomyces]MBT3072877.1 5-dehydro-4-deoxyglucarate dehydratase [Streptomyces sp. COG21]MBT3081287.1 5-dehydro-4-deoxyglucarate dehydratase [Streptomyces sp. COG20]MBT3088220.1 5-dehydro-4-deoxyglucarate dehydratase [Streptomyces sp. CYG21]MBT3102873.1 5-dehydro-4-deoxyglucarate dehydratase [Streptomyces sp. COG19]MDI7790807.1 5-dehydro-4-deoxyglucarate dehydratase [Streptomyces cavourensis]
MKLSGVLFFPATPFDSRGEVDVAVLRAHVAAGLEHGPGGVFAACGTGELNALAEGEQALVVRETVAAADGAIPVVAGAGGALGTALAHTRAAAEAGADAVLLLPPYLALGSAEGLHAYVSAVAEVGLPVVLYQRGPLVLEPAAAVGLTRIPGVVGFKDGLGDIDRMQRTVLAVRAAHGPDEITFFNGLPTAELTQPAYRAIGVHLYSSAAFCFVPEVATAYRDALETGSELAGTLLSEFYGPLVELRSSVPGYAVALVKAGLRLRGVEAGKVRAPFVEPTAAHLSELARIIDRGLAAVRAGS